MLAYDSGCRPPAPRSVRSRVTRHGSLTRPAKAVNISQPTFTVQIRHLEAALLNTRAFSSRACGSVAIAALPTLSASVAGLLRYVIGFGTSQSGNFIHLGFHEDESKRMVWDRVNPNIAARQKEFYVPARLPTALGGCKAQGFRLRSSAIFRKSWSTHRQRRAG